MSPFSGSASPVASEETVVEDAIAKDKTSQQDHMRDQDEKHNADDGPTQTDLSDIEEFQEGGYGWVVVLSVFLINMHTWGMNSAYAVFLAYYLNSDAFPGSSAISFAFVGGLSISIALLLAPLATICIRKYGTRTCLQIGVLLETVAFIGASFTTQIWHLVLSQGIAFGAGMGFLFTGSVGIIPQFFNRKRSLANSIGTAGSGFGGLTYSLAANAMIDDLGLDWAFRILAILAFVVNGISSFLARDRNKAVGAMHAAFHMELFRKAEVYLFLAWAFFSLMSYVIVVFSIADYCQAAGFTATQGSIAAAIFNLSQGLGRPLIGLTSDRFGRINVAAFGTLIAGVAAFFLWIFAAKYYAGAIVYSLFGAFAGTIWPCVAPVGVEVVGLQLLPSAMSITWLVLVLPATFAEAIGLSLRKPGTNGYIGVQVYVGSMYTAAFIALWGLRIWKIRQIEAGDFTEEKREHNIRKPDAVDAGPTADKSRRGRCTFTAGIKACFSMAKV